MKRMKQIEKRVYHSSETNRAADWGRYVFQKDIYEVFVPFSQGHVVFKLLPGLNPDDAGETTDPMILPNGKPGNWQTKLRIVSCGEPGKTVTYCEYDDYEDPSSIGDSPYSLAYKMCQQMSVLEEDNINRIGDWVSLIKNGTATRAATMPKAADRVYAFCVPYYTNKGVYDHELTKRKLHVLCLKKKASEALDTKCYECFQADPPIDLTDMQTGPFIAMWSGAASNPFTGEAGNANKMEYNIQLFNKMPHNGASCDISADKETYLNLLDSWSEIINFPSFEQQAKYLMKALPLDLLAQAWSDVTGYRSFVTPDMAKALEAGKAEGWQKRQQRIQAQLSQYQMANAQAVQANVATPTAPVTPAVETPKVASPLISDIDIPVAPVQPPKPESPMSNIPPAYPPVPNKFSNLVEDIPFDEDSDGPIHLN